MLRIFFKNLLFLNVQFFAKLFPILHHEREKIPHFLIVPRGINLRVKNSSRMLFILPPK